MVLLYPITSKLKKEFMVVKTYDIVIVGLGAAGSAALYQASKRGAKVLGIDQFHMAHPYGSSHGESRITRLAIGEDWNLTPFAMRSHEIWREHEERFEMYGQLLLQTGGLIIGETGAGTAFHGNSDFLGTTIQAASLYKIRHEILGSEEIRRRFPVLMVKADAKGYYEYDAGILFPEKCVRANLLTAQRLGAKIVLNCKVLDMEFSANSVTLATNLGFISAGKVIISAGAWVSTFLPASQRDYFKPTRQTVHYFKPRTSESPFLVNGFPVFIWTDEGIYGFPNFGKGHVRIAQGSYNQVCNPDNVDREISRKEIREINETISRLIPALRGGYTGGDTCIYTVTPDEGFVIDDHPDSENVLLVSACSGHGFKHSAAIGELASQIVLNEPHRYDMSKFSLSRSKKPAQ